MVCTTEKCKSESHKRTNRSHIYICTYNHVPSLVVYTTTHTLKLLFSLSRHHIIALFRHIFFSLQVSAHGHTNVCFCVCSVPVYRIKRAICLVDISLMYTKWQIANCFRLFISRALCSDGVPSTRLNNSLFGWATKLEWILLCGWTVATEKNTPTCDVNEAWTYTCRRREENTNFNDHPSI